MTDGDGHARFDPGLARGTGGMALQLVDAKTDGGDYAFLDLTRSAFDLSDRGVEGRAAPQPLDVFLTPERGIYRPGETMHLTALVRDPRATAVPALPLTLVVVRPDGVEFLRKTVADSGLGGYSADVAFDGNAMRGSWSVQLFADPKGAALAQTSVLVEDFEPERLAFELSTEAKAMSRHEPTSIDLVAKYLYGATAPGLSVEGDIEVSPVTALATFPGFRFGLADETVEAERNSLELDAKTDEDGKASFDVSLPELKSATRLFEATLIIRLADTNGRTVERTLKLPVKSDGMKIGIRPLFNADTGMDENAEARFEVVAVSPDGQRVAEKGLTWKLERLETQYQWYKSDRGWNYELITDTQRVANGTVDTSADGPATLGAKVEWGRYRLTVASEGDRPTASSVEFEAGWYVGNATSETPDVLKVGARQAGLQDRRDRQAPPRPALRRHGAGLGHRRPADRHEGGRGAGRRHHRRLAGHRGVGPRRLRHRLALPADGHRGEAHAGPRPRPRPGPRSRPATASSPSRSTCPTRCGRADR